MPKKIKVEYVALYFRDWLADLLVMPPDIRGAYCSLCFKIYDEGGWLKDDKNELAGICGFSPLDFARVWPQLARKFLQANGVVTHRRCTKELLKVARLRQAQRKAGLTTAKKRWVSDKLPIADRPHTDNQRERDEYEDEIKNKNTNTRTRNVYSEGQKNLSDSSSRAPSLSDSSRTQADVLRVSQVISRILLPNNNADRSAIDNLSRWAVGGNCTQRVFDLAHEALKAKRINNNRFAYFFDTVQRELGYRAAAQRKGQ
jgi:uncharacterized protein YdaU (DUF1376 family)